MPSISALCSEREAALAAGDNKAALALSRQIDELQSGAVAPRPLDTAGTESTRQAGDGRSVSPSLRKAGKAAVPAVPAVPVASTHSARSTGLTPPLEQTPAGAVSPFPVPAGALSSPQDYDAALAARDAALAALREVYPRVCAEMRALVAQIVAADVLAAKINRTRPPGKLPIVSVHAKLRKEAGTDQRVKADITKHARLPNLLSRTPQGSLRCPSSFISMEKYK